MGKTYSKRGKGGGGREFVRGGEVKGRDSRFQSGTALYRRAEPDNPSTAKRTMNFVPDFTENKPVVPKRLGSCRAGYQTMNASGRSAVALPGITVGSGTDDKGHS